MIQVNSQADRTADAHTHLICKMSPSFLADVKGAKLLLIYKSKFVFSVLN